ncbi:hypothetical protein F3J02_03615 [Acinetobacter sp. Tr-809]|uniref:hypothetical protein n=1 Tax=Acinetobacter sp. Tr-809 TaxID=2608324 RepID=UPI001421C9BA|nr:hypothetical protein [Acinetobacter sp. Tr-809]NIE95578.1 hypothetical protein [Acinetobacter sp. Tr-809]
MSKEYKIGKNKPKSKNYIAKFTSSNTNIVKQNLPFVIACFDAILSPTQYWYNISKLSTLENFGYGNAQKKQFIHAKILKEILQRYNINTYINDSELGLKTTIPQFIYLCFKKAQIKKLPDFEIFLDLLIQEQLLEKQKS